MKRGSKLRIGYVPYSQDISHPADRRRIGMWSRESKTPLQITNPLDSNVLVLSNNANLGWWIRKAHQPVILDLVDGYLGSSPSFFKDFSRNLLRSVTGRSELKWLTYNNHLTYACRRAACVVVASPEQQQSIQHLNENIHIILDDHSEFYSQTTNQETTGHEMRTAQEFRAVFWEGMGSNLQHFRNVSLQLDKWLSESGWTLFLLTEQHFTRYSTFLGKTNSIEYIQSMFPLSWNNVKLVPWSIENVVNYSKIADFAIIPINQNDKFARLKSENKLMSMWSLGLPTLTSKTPAYLRIARSITGEDFTIDESEWYSSLKKFSSNSNRRIEWQKQGNDFISLKHTRELIFEKWTKAIGSVN